MSNTDLLKVKFHIEKKEGAPIEVNGLKRGNILNEFSIGISCYEAVCNPRIISEEEKLNFTSSQIERIIKEILRCNICNEIYQEPVNIKNCLHKFCKKCIEDYNRKIKKECAICRHQVETRRLMKEDSKMKDIINCFIPDIPKFKDVEMKAINKILEKCYFKGKIRQQQQLEQQKKTQEADNNEAKENIHQNLLVENIQQESNRVNTNVNIEENIPGNNNANAMQSGNANSTMLNRKTQRDNQNDMIMSLDSKNNILVRLYSDETEQSLKKFFTKTRLKIQENYTLEFISRFICYKQNFKFEQVKKIKFYTFNNDKSKKFWAQKIELKDLLNYQNEHNISNNGHNLTGDNANQSNGKIINLYFLISQ